MTAVLTALSALAVTAAVVVAVSAVHYRRIAAVAEEQREIADSRRRELADFILRFSSGLRRTNDTESAMHAAARRVAEQTDAESCAIYEVSGEHIAAAGVHGNYPLTCAAGSATRHYRLFENMRRETVQVGRGFLGMVAATGQAELVPDGSTDYRFVDYPSCSSLGSIMAIPLFQDGNLSGLVCVVNNRSGGSFSEQQLERLKSLSGQVRTVCELVNVYRELSRRNRLDQELEFARNLQLSLLPQAFPSWDQFSINAFSRPAKEMNGDFYDFVEIDSERLLVIIGDACGKGIPACLLTAMARSYARCLATEFTSLAEFLKAMNDKLYRDIDSDRFLTLGCCLVDKKQSLVEFGRAGHTDLVQFVHNHIRTLLPDGSALGILPPEFAGYDTICMSIDPGTSVLMFSDGITEALNQDNQEFGLKRLTEVFAAACAENMAPEQAIEHVMNAVVDYEAGQNDDQTLVLIRHTGRIGA